MADGWNPNQSAPGTQDGETLTFRPRPGDDNPFGLAERFPTPDYTDDWQAPNPGDNLLLNSGRYKRPLFGIKGAPEQQNVSDKDALEGRLSRLRLVKAIEEEQRERKRLEAALKAAKQEARRDIVEATFDAMLDSCYNQGQYEKMKNYRAEFVAKYAYGDSADVNRASFLGYWTDKLGLSNG